MAALVLFRHFEELPIEFRLLIRSHAADALLPSLSHKTFRPSVFFRNFACVPSSFF